MTSYVIKLEGRTWSVYKRTRRLGRQPRFVLLGVWSTVNAAADHQSRLSGARRSLSQLMGAVRAR